MPVTKCGSRNIHTYREKYKCYDKIKRVFTNHLPTMCHTSLHSMKMLPNTSTIIQVTPIFQMIKLKAELDSRNPSSKADTLFSMKIRYHSSMWVSL